MHYDTHLTTRVDNQAKHTFIRYCLRVSNQERYSCIYEDPNLDEIQQSDYRHL